MKDHILEFIDFCRKNGIPPAAAREIVADDRKRRFQVAGDRRGTRNAGYRLAISGDFSFGWVHCHKQRRTYDYYSKNTSTMTADQRRQIDADMARRRLQNEEKLAMGQEEAAALAKVIWAAARKDDEIIHQYAIRKNIDMKGLGIATTDQSVNRGELLVPIRDITGKLWNIQRINGKGGKYFLPGGRITGCYSAVGKRTLFADEPFVFCEGRATGGTLHRILRAPVVCCLNAGNLLPVARHFRRKYRFARFIYACDSDYWTMRQDVRQDRFPDISLSEIPGDDPRWEEWRQAGFLWNPGTDKARAAAAITGGECVTLPVAYSRHTSRPTDFNDMAALSGDESVRSLFKPYL